MKIRRKFFTLIEMVIVITLLTLFTGVIGINIAQALREQKFLTEVGIVLDRLRLAQNLMLIMNRDVDIIVEGKGDEGIEIRLDVEGGFPKNWAKTIKNAEHLLTTIHRFEFEDPETPKTANQTTIRFYSGGTVMSRGVIRLATHEDLITPAAITRGICLKGYPHPIVSEKEEDDKIECSEKNTEYDEQLTLYTIEELKLKALQEETDKLEESGELEEGESRVQNQTEQENLRYDYKQ